MKQFYVNLSTGAISEKQTASCTTPVAGQVHQLNFSCSLYGCHFLIITPEALLTALESTAGKYALELPVRESLKGTKESDVPATIRKHWMPRSTEKNHRR